MNVVIKILELYYDKKLSYRQIAKLAGVGKSTVFDYIKMFEKSDLKWPLDPSYCALTLSKKLNPQFISKHTDNIDFNYVNKEIQRKNVTLKLVYQELSQENKANYSYSHFCRVVKKQNKKTCYMKQVYKNGEKVFVDYSGDKTTIIENGKKIDLELFVGVLGASGYLYAECSYNQKSESFINTISRMFEYFNGVPEIVVTDNLKSAITKASKSEPVVNKEFEKALNHYGAITIPARPYKPKDKSLAENGVLIAQRSILAVIRNQTFYSIAEINKTIRELVEKINNKKYTNKPYTRKELFVQKDLPFLKKINSHYKFKKHKKVIVGRDYHFLLNNVNYSVPYKHVGQTLDVYYDDLDLDCYLDDKLLLSHKINQDTVTIFEHMPKNHQFVTNSKKFLTKDLGPNLKVIVDYIYKNFHKEISDRKVQGFLKIANKDDLEILCKQAIENNIYDYEEIIKLARFEVLKSTNQNLIKQPLKTFA